MPKANVSAKKSDVTNKGPTVVDKRAALKKARKTREKPELMVEDDDDTPVAGPINETRIPVSEAPRKRSSKRVDPDEDEDEDEETESRPKRPTRVDPKNQKEVDGLLTDLEDASDPNEKKKIRRRLRALGHMGGLRQGSGPVAKKAKKEKQKNDKVKLKRPDPELDEDGVEEVDED